MRVNVNKENGENATLVMLYTTSSKLSCWFFLALTVTLLQITCELSENVAVASKVFEMQLQQLIGDLFAL